MTNINSEMDMESNGVYPYHLAAMIDKKLEELTHDYEDIPVELAEPIKYCLLSGGKRLRPVLSLATAISLGRDPEYVLPAACAVEFIHSYSLIHDDLPAIDNDDLRRGKPSCHRKFGEDIAILAGDAIFAEAFNIILKYQEGTSDMILGLLSEIATASGASGMVAGQVVDITAPKSGISGDRLEYMHINKTARLITAAITGTAVLCGAEKVIIEKYREFGLNIGLAFQITDDIIDITSKSTVMGKTQGKDRQQSKNTYPRLWGIDRSRKIAEEKVLQAIDVLENTDTDNTILKDIAKFILVRRA